MNEQDAINILKEFQESGDTELAHVQADDLLCQFLIDLGYVELVEEYNKVDKWYA